MTSVYCIILLHFVLLHTFLLKDGLCLNALHDKAFDKGLITIDKNYYVVNSKQLKDAEMDEESRVWLQSYEGKRIILPDRFYPGKQFVEYHNDVMFKGV